MASCFDLARLPDALIKSARTATFVVAVATTLTPHETGAQSQSSSVRSTWVRFQPGNRDANGFADASIGIKYVTRECFGRVGLLIDLNPLFFRTTSVYWFNGQRMNVPQNVSVQAPSSVPVSGQIAGLIRGPSTFATDVTTSGMSCVDGVQLGKFEEYWDPKTVTEERRRFHLNAITIGATDPAPPLTNSSVENALRRIVAQQRSDSIARVAQARRDSTERATAARRQASGTRTPSSPSSSATGSARATPVQTGSPSSASAPNRPTADQQRAEAERRAADSTLAAHRERSKRLEQEMFTPATGGTAPATAEEALANAAQGVAHIMEQREQRKRRENQREARLAQQEQERISTMIRYGDNYWKAGQYETAFTYYRSVPTNGYVLARFGDAYYQGLGVTQNKRTALDYYSQSCRAGSSRGCEEMTHVTADISAERQRLVASAEQGNDDAKYAAAVTLWNQGDAASAIPLARTAAAASHARSQLLLGMAYRTGQGVERNAAESARWYKSAFESGSLTADESASAALGLGSIHGGTSEWQESQRWYELVRTRYGGTKHAEAAEKGLAELEVRRRRSAELAGDSAARIAKNKWGTVGFFGGIAGPIGITIAYSSAAGSDVQVPLELESRAKDPQYQQYFDRAYTSRLKARRKSSAFKGGLVGNVAIVAVLMMMISSGN